MAKVALKTKKKPAKSPAARKAAPVKKAAPKAKAAAEAHVAGTKWTSTPLPAEIVIEATALEAKWDEAMADDMNTAAALGHVFVLMKIVNRILEDKTLKKSEQGRDMIRHA